jgi:hypothetical protein
MDDEGDKPTTMRRMLRAVGEESEGRDESLPDETATDAEAWEWLLEEFEGRIFWDADFATGDEFLDLPPDEPDCQPWRGGTGVRHCPGGRRQ